MNSPKETDIEMGEEKNEHPSDTADESNNNSINNTKSEDKSKDDEEGSSNAASLGGQNVRVVARVRPLSSKETCEQSKESLIAIPESKLIRVDRSRTFEYDEVFSPSASQSRVYEGTAGDMVRTNLFRGFNVTILAYGQTGSGKTFTMGTEGGSAANSNTSTSSSNAQFDDTASQLPLQLTAPTEADGIIPRAVYDLFRTRDEMKQGIQRVKVEMSYLEIYNEEARDLLRSIDLPDEISSSFTPDTLLQIRDSGTDGVVVQGLSRTQVHSPLQVSSLMAAAARRRVTAATAMNAVSSRSHAICTLHVVIAPIQDEDNTSKEQIRAKLTLVDLAGSERIKRTGAEGARMKEGININKGLFVLGQVISGLSELSQQNPTNNSSLAQMHVPYRDSKLTRLLQDSLGGNSRTVMVACVSPADSNTEESINTLRYAQRTRNIKNSAVRNVMAAPMSPAEAAALRRENQMLKLQLLQAQMKANSIVNSNTSVPHLTSANPSSSLKVETGNNENFGDFANVGVDVEKLEIVTRLRATCSSLRSKVEQLENDLQSSAEDALTSNFRGDKWQLRYEQIVAFVKSQGLKLSDEHGDTEGLENPSLVTQLRKEVVDLQQEVKEARADAALARATAAAIVAGGGDLSAAEEIALSEVTPEVTSEDGANSIDTETRIKQEQMTAELVAMSNQIEQKEVMAAKLNKEREYAEQVRTQFEGIIHAMQDEVTALTSERDALQAKLHQDTNSGAHGKKRPGQMTKAITEGNPERRRMKTKIADLESRIKELKVKASEHKKSMRLRDIAEKKCSDLAAEIAEDKRRRGALQRKLKEMADERRTEKRAAEIKATRILRDSQKLKYELNKVKDAAAKQAAVLRRKATEAINRQKAMAEQNKRRNNARQMNRHGNGPGHEDCTNQRKEELLAWLEREANASSALRATRDQIEEQTLLLQQAVTKRDEQRSISRGGSHSNDENSKAALRAAETEVDARTGVIQQLERNLDEICRAAMSNASAPVNLSSASGFLDVAIWQGLTRSEVKFVLTSLYEKFLVLRKESEAMRFDQDKSRAKAVRKALAEEKRKFDEKLIELKMQHSEKMACLLDSTKGAMEHKVQSDFGMNMEIDESMKEKIDEMLGPYLDGCSKIGETVKEELKDVREQQVGMKGLMDQVVGNLIATNEAKAMTVLRKAKKAKRKVSPRSSDEEEIFFASEEEKYDDNSDESDWYPPPTRRTRQKLTKEAEKSAPDAAAVPTQIIAAVPTQITAAVPTQITAAVDGVSEKTNGDEDLLLGEQILSKRDEEEEEGKSTSTSTPAESGRSLEKLKVADLRKMLRERGLTVSGKKAELLRRLRSTNPRTSPISEVSDSSENKENVEIANGGNLAAVDITKAFEKANLQVETTMGAATRRSSRRLALANNNNNKTRKKRSPKTRGVGGDVAFWSTTERSMAFPDREKESLLAKRPMAITDSAKKRQRNDMFAAVNKAVLQLETMDISVDKP